MPNPKNKKRLKGKPPGMSVDTALEVVDEDLPDGAYFAVMSELTGMDAGEIATSMARKATGGRRRSGPPSRGR